MSKRKGKWKYFNEKGATHDGIRYRRLTTLEGGKETIEYEYQVLKPKYFGLFGSKIWKEAYTTKDYKEGLKKSIQLR